MTANYVVRPGDDLVAVRDRIRRMRIFREMPGFQPIPWEKIGNYKDAWRR